MDPAPAAAITSSNIPPEVSATLLDLQNQLRSVTAALEQVRKDSEAATQRSNEALTERLTTLEKGLFLQLQREQDLMRESNRTEFMKLFAMAGLGILVLVVAVWFQVRALNRVTEIANLQREALALLLPPGHGLPAGELPPAGGGITPSSQRLRGAVGNLQSRLGDLEQGRGPSQVDNPPAQNNRQSGGERLKPALPPPAPAFSSTSAAPAAENQRRAAALIERGQDLLTAGQMDKALDCFDQALALDPNNANALLKKGAALQAQKKLMEALDFYDRAIKADRSLTLAYLCKGGVYNQLERFDEALQCYEQAQRLQESAGIGPGGARG